MHFIDQINTKPNSLYRFENFHNNQDEVEVFREKLSHSESGQFIISGESGFGVTHLLNATCNHFKDHKKVMYMTSQWLIHLIKICNSEHEINELMEGILTYDVIAIDNIQFLHRKSFKHQQFILELIDICKKERKWLVLGTSEPKKDFTKSKKNCGQIELTRINLKGLSSSDVFKGLKSLCSMEDRMPDNLLYAISGYNGPFKQHVNCLIAVRFKSKIQGINLAEISLEQFSQRFQIGSFFPRQQFRRCFIQTELVFNGIKDEKRVWVDEIKAWPLS